MSAEVRLKPDPTTATAAHRLRVAIGLIVLAGVCAFWNSLSGPFVWDDQTAIVNNQTIRELWPLSGPLSPPPETPVAGRPIANLSFAINYAIGGLNVTGYHVWNVGVHIICALVLFGIVRRTLINARTANNVRLKQYATNETTGDIGYETSTALVAALLWIVHPLQTEAVDYLTERTESMMGLFFFLTLYCAIRARRSRHAGRWTAASIAACVLGIATKESMVTAPLVVLLYDRVFEFPSFGEAFRARTALYAGLAATWIELGVLEASAGRSTVGASATVSAWTYLLNQAEMITRYLRLTVWPHALVLDYGLPRMITLREVAPQVLLLALLFAATMAALVRWPVTGFLGATFFLTLAPTSSFVPIVSEVGAERRMYVPLAALSVLVVMAARVLLDRAGDRLKVVPYRRLAGGVATIILVALAVRTIYRNREYLSPISLWQTVVERRPHGRARMSLATELVAAGRHDEAMPQLRQAVRDFPPARYALGTELFAEGNMTEAAGQLQQFISLDPGRADRIPARLLLGRVLMAQGRLDEAEQQFQTVLAESSQNDMARRGLADLAIAYVDRADALLRQNTVPQAEAAAREALRLKPREAAAHNLLGVALASQGKLDAAVVQFREALQLKPTDSDARNNLARALALLSKP